MHNLEEESVLFSGQIPVRVAAETHEEKVRTLMFHISLVSESPQNHKVLRIQITEEVTILVTDVLIEQRVFVGGPVLLIYSKCQ